MDDDCDGRFDENFVDLNPCATETCSGGVLTSTPTPGACPPDPLGSGPSTIPGTSTPFAESLDGLIGDYQTVPSGTTPEAIVPERATRLYGEVHTLTGGPMGGVRVSVLDHPGLGSVLTRADGRFDLVVNGGNVLTVVFERVGHPTVHRTIRTGWNEHVWVPDVVMTPLDTATSIAGLGSGTSTLQIHRGSAVNDGDGLGIERRATLLIPRETRGTYTRADGSSAPLPATSTLRATEFTVGALGPDAMPATLPSQIMYTYALELSIDEADADGAEQVQFDRVLPFYVENFLGFPIGTAVPTGWYDRVAARWRPSADGIVVAVVGVASGRAQLDLTGDGVAEDALALAPYGIDTDELAALGGLYPVGTSLWRVPIEHFTTWDHNWPGVPAPGARDPNDPAPDLAGEPESCEVPGSIVQCENRTVAEELPILGTDLSLRYQSDRVPGARHTRRVRFLAIDDGPSGPPPNRIGVEANVEIAGRRISIAVPEPDDEGRAYAEYEWDGLDWRGRPTTRPERALIELCHVYPAQPASPEVAPTVTEVGTTSTFGRWGSFVRARPEIDRSQRRATARLCKRGFTDRYFGTLDARLEHGLGGLMLTARDVPSPEGQSLHRGDGTSQRSADAYRIETLIRHNQVLPRRNINDVGATADNICMPVIEGHAVDPEGQLIFSIEEDLGCNGNGVWRLNQDRTLTRLVGTGTWGWFRPEHEGQLATAVPLHTPTDLAYGPDGSLFVADLRNARVFRVRQDGTRETVIGRGEHPGGARRDASDEPAGEGLRGTDVYVRPESIDVTSDGTLIVYDGTFQRIRAVRADGTVETLVGGAGHDPTNPSQPARILSPRSAFEGTPARSWNLNVSFPNVAVHPITQEIYFSVGSRIIRRDSAGALRSVTGGIASTSVQPGDPASTFPVESGNIRAMAFDPSGALYFVAPTVGERIWRIDSSERLELVAGGGPLPGMFEGIPATEANIANTYGNKYAFSFAPDGSLYATLSVWDASGLATSRHIARIWRPGRNRGASSLVTREGNVDVFDALGRHVETRHGITDAVLRTFAYDDQGRLDTIRDAMNNLVDVQYVGNEIRFVAPLGETTRLTLDASGWVRDVSYVGDPDFVSGSRGFSRFHFDASPGREGLLQVYRDRRGQEHHLQHDAWGYLASDLATGSGRSWTLAGGDTVREDGQRRRTVTLTSSQGRVRTHEVTHGDVIEHRVIEPDGTVTRSEERVQQGMTSGKTTWASDGSQTITSFTPDPDLGWSAAYPSQSVFRLPSQGSAAGSTDRTVTASSVASIVAEAEDGSPRHRRWTTTTETGEASREWERLSDGRSVSRTISAMGRRTVTIYDLLDRPIWSAVVDAAGQPLFHPVTYTYDDGLGRPTRITQAPTDASQRPILTDVEQTRTVELDYPGAGRLGHVTQPHGDSAFSPADPNERMRTSFGYDPIGRVTSSSSNGAATGFGYDVMGQLTRVTPPGRGDHTMTYSADEQLASYAPPAYTDPDAAPGAPRVATPSTWAPGPDRDEVASYTVTRGAETRSSGQTYDPTTGRLASMTIGGVPGSVTFSYAPRAGESVSDTGQLRHASMPQTRAGSSAVATTLYYDGPLGTETRTEGLPNAPWKVGYHHDAADELRLAHLTVAVGSTSTNVPTIAYDYDADGLITSLGYGYDGDGIALREGSYDENVAPTPTLARSMAVVPDPQTGVLAQTCVGGTVALGSGTCSGRVSTTITPNDFGEPASVETTWNGSSVSGSLSFHYEHDRAGRIVARTEVEGASSTRLEYGYDAQGRLENVWRRTSPTTRERLYHYQYDANGNRIGWALPSGTCNPTVSTCTRVDEQDRLLSAGGVSYWYDLQGQLATRTEGTRAETFTYDMAGNLRTFAVREGGTQTRHVQYAIDAFGRRVGRYVGTSGATSPDRFWVYQDGLNPVAQLNAMGQLELLFLYGTQAHVPDLVVEVRGASTTDDVVYRVVTDQVGSVRRLVNVETGAVAASFDYSPFGVLEREDGALAARFPFRFAGGLWDGDTGLVRFGARDYDPRVGRWTAKDPILWGGGQGNLYEYCGSEPVNCADLNGLTPWSLDELAAQGLQMLREHKPMLQNVVGNVALLGGLATDWIMGREPRIETAEVGGIVAVEYYNHPWMSDGYSRTLGDTICYASDGRSPFFGRHRQHEHAHVEQYEALGMSYIPLHLLAQVASYDQTGSYNRANALEIGPSSTPSKPWPW